MCTSGNEWEASKKKARLSGVKDLTLFDHRGREASDFGCRWASYRKF